MERYGWKDMGGEGIMRRCVKIYEYQGRSYGTTWTFMTKYGKILEDMGITGKIWEYQGIYGNIRKYMGISRNIWEYQGIYGNISKDMGILGKIWKYQERCLIYVGRY